MKIEFLNQAEQSIIIDNEGELVDSCDAVSCSPKGGFTWMTNLLSNVPQPYRIQMGMEIEQRMEHQTEVGILCPDDINSPYYLLIAPIIRGRTESTRSQAKSLMEDLLAACARIEAKSLQLTQFAIRCVDSHLHGVLDALYDSKDFNGLQRISLMRISDKELTNAVNESRA